jgi:glycosyltransferase involved in cell wall biosynthesis
VKLGLLTTSYPRSEHDVPGHFVRGFARALAARGHQLEVLAPEPAEGVLAATAHDVGVQLRWVRYLLPRELERTFYGAGVLDNVRREPLRALGLPTFVLALTRATHEAMPRWDAVISHWALPSALIAGELCGARVHLAVLHSADVFVLEQLPTALLRRLVSGRIASRATALLFSSRDLRRRFLALLSPLSRVEHAARAHVCPMGIEPALPAREPRAALRERLGMRGFTVLSLGRLISLKGVEHAIDAAVSVDAELWVCGEGPVRPALERHAAARGARVRFMGSVFGAEKTDLFRAADAFVLPSVVLPSGRSEGMPQTVLEAMEHGLPVVASDVGGVSDVVRSDENGFLVAPGEPHAIASALRALHDPLTHARLSAAARETARLYHWSELAPHIEGLLRGHELD